MPIKDQLLSIINSIRLNKNQPLLDRINDTAHLRKDLDFDSIDLAELTVKVEHELGVDVFKNGLVSSVGEVLHIIQNNKLNK